MNIEQVIDNGDYIRSKNSELILKELSANAVGQFIYRNTDGDEVKVVRCKDCKHSIKHSEHIYECDCFCAMTTPNFYCADGERKEQNECE